MNNNKFIISALSLFASLLLLMGTLNFVVDPLFQYHKQWLGTQPVLTDERYQNAGVAKTFDFENAIIGNSLSENFRASWFDEALGGKTVKLTVAGAHSFDYTYFFELLKQREHQPENIIICIDAYIFLSDAHNLQNPLPFYLYDNNPFNDVSYLYNFSILKDFTFNTVKCNLKNTVPNIDEAFVWETEHNNYGKEFVLATYKRAEKAESERASQGLLELTRENLDNITPYMEQMPNTNFIFAFSPLSIVYWDDVNQTNSINAMQEVYNYAAERLLSHPNASVYFWEDEQMQSIICDLDNYVDNVHYSSEVSFEMVRRIGEGTGKLDGENYADRIAVFFDFLRSYPYETIFE